MASPSHRQGGLILYNEGDFFKKPETLTELQALVEKHLNFKSPVFLDALRLMAYEVPGQKLQVLNRAMSTRTRPQVSPFDSMRPFHTEVDDKRKRRLIPRCNLELCENYKELSVLTRELDHLVLNCLNIFFRIPSEVTRELDLSSIKAVNQRRNSVLTAEEHAMMNTLLL